VFLIKTREVAQAGSAPGLGPGGRRFESCLPDLRGQNGIIPILSFFISSETLVQQVNQPDSLVDSTGSKYIIFKMHFFGEHRTFLSKIRLLKIVKSSIG
jgi:hypothetical protein